MMGFVDGKRMHTIKYTPLHDLHLQLGARMVPFGGWEMPVQYSGLSSEHQAVRTGAGIFDISHMGKFRLSGRHLLRQLQALVPSDLSRLKPGDARYTLLLNAQAGIIDDVIFYCRGADDWVIIANGATADKDNIWLQQHLDTVFSDCTTEETLLALQGPQAVQILQPFTDADLGRVGRFAHVETRILACPAFIARTGYTGEDGFEIMMPVEGGRALWQRLVELGVPPCGLGARDTLRLEAAMHLYGQDMDESTTPLEASLGWVIDWEKPPFLGQDVLEEQKRSGVTRRLVGFTMHARAIARHGYSIWVGGERVGIVTSGTLPPTLNRPIGLGYVPAASARVGSEIQVEIRGQLVPASVVKRPFYQRVQ